MTILSIVGVTIYINLFCLSSSFIACSNIYLLSFFPKCIDTHPPSSRFPSPSHHPPEMSIKEPRRLVLTKPKWRTPVSEIPLPSNPSPSVLSYPPFGPRQILQRRMSLGLPPPFRRH